MEQRSNPEIVFRGLARKVYSLPWDEAGQNVTFTWTNGEIASAGVDEIGWSLAQFVGYEAWRTYASKVYAALVAADWTDESADAHDGIEITLPFPGQDETEELHREVVTALTGVAPAPNTDLAMLLHRIAIEVMKWHRRTAREALNARELRAQIQAGHVFNKRIKELNTGPVHEIEKPEVPEPPESIKALNAKMKETKEPEVDPEL